MSSTNDAERMRLALAESGVDPARVQVADDGTVEVVLDGLSDAEQRIVHRGWRLVDPANSPENYEDWG